MRTRIYLVAALTMMAVIVQSPAQAQGPAAQPFNTGLGDLMNTFIQPRHAKLGLAAQNENWELADYVLHELKQSLAKVGQSRPKFRNLSVPEMIEGSTGDSIRGLEQAIKAHNMRQFSDAYDKLTQGCNGCHAATNHAFVVIKAPDQSSFLNQDFRSAK
jgi:hypothetical protein